MREEGATQRTQMNNDTALNKAHMDNEASLTGQILSEPEQGLG